MSLPTQKYLTPTLILEAAGFRFSLDYDGSLVTAAPATINRNALLACIAKWERAIACEIIRRAERDRARFHGGPMDGRRCTWWHPYACSGYESTHPYFKGVRIERAKWAVYSLKGDGRAFFVGWAKSQAKARQGNLYETARGASG